MQEVLEISNKKGVFETGGGHGQKGVDFQRYWAVLRMIELEQTGAKDFLLLFESIQDIAEFDSVTTPTSVKIYQIKKKERSEWTWGQLTGLPAVSSKLSNKPAGKKAKVDKDKFGDSPIGKLYRSVIAFQQLKSIGKFVSNAGCDIELTNGGNLATSLPCDLTKLSAPHVELLNEAVGMLGPTGSYSDLERLSIERTSLPANEIEKHVIGVVFTFLKERSPRHSAQAQSFMDALVA